MVIKGVNLQLNPTSNTLSIDRMEYFQKQKLPQTPIYLDLSPMTPTN